MQLMLSHLEERKSKVLRTLAELSGYFCCVFVSESSFAFNEEVVKLKVCRCVNICYNMCRSLFYYTDVILTKHPEMFKTGQIFLFCLRVHLASLL